MKKLIALALVLMLGCAALAEGGAFALESGATWGMSPSEVLALEEGKRVELDKENGKDVVEVEDTTFRGVEADLDYWFQDDALAMAVYDLDREDLAPEALIEQLDGEYGPHADDKGKAYYDALSDLTGVTYYVQPEMEGVLATWSLPDGTLAMVVTELEPGEDDYAVLYLYTGQIAASDGDLGEPAPALEP